MNKLLILLALVAACTAINEESFIRGYLSAIEETKDPADLFPCVRNIRDIVYNLYVAYGIMKPMTAQAIMIGISRVFDLTGQLFNTLRPCSAGYTQLEYFERKVNSRSIAEILSKIYGSMKFYTNEVIRCIKSYLSSNSLEMGHCFANVPYKLVAA